MKSTVFLIIALIAHPAFAQPDIKLLGNEADYVATALEKIGVRGTASATGSFTVNGGHGLFGWSLRSVDLSSWPTLPNLVAFRVMEAMKSDGWTAHEPGVLKDARLFPTHFMITATRDEEVLEAIVTIFPEEGGKIGVAYSQRRSPKEPNQPVDSTPVSAPH